MTAGDTPRPFDPDWVVAPGETLREWFEAMGLPLSVAGLYGIPPRTLERLFRGTQKISPPIARKLCNLTHIGAPFWLALEHNFRAGLAAGKSWDAAVSSVSGTPPESAASGAPDGKEKP